jgi:hypothetical protein
MGSAVLVHQDLGGVALVVRFERVLEFPLGTTDLPTRERSGEFAAGQGRAEPRPQNDDNNVGVARRGDQFLEMMGGHQRLALPHHRPQVEVK